VETQNLASTLPETSPSRCPRWKSRSTTPTAQHLLEYIRPAATARTSPTRRSEPQISAAEARDVEPAAEPRRQAGSDLAQQLDGGPGQRAGHHLPDHTTSWRLPGPLRGTSDALTAVPSLLAGVRLPFPGSLLTLQWTVHILA